MRLLTNIVLTRLLAPEVLGIMVLVNSLRTGIELISDVGVGQNIIHSKEGDARDFYNTAWTVQVLRGGLLFALCWAVSQPIADLYDNEILGVVLPVAALGFIISGLNSVSVFILQRRLQLVKLNVFDGIVDALSAIAHILLAYFYNTIWGLIFGMLAATACRSALSHAMLPELEIGFRISSCHVWKLLAFGKWIFLSSILYFLSMNIDRLYLGGNIPLGLLGIYGVARALSDVSALLAGRLGNYIIFPFVSSAYDVPRILLRERMIAMRRKLLVSFAFCVALFVSCSDVIIAFLYDARYQQAAWMMPILYIGAWFSILASFNESVLLGFGKPLCGAVGNGGKLAFLGVGLPLVIDEFYIIGAMLVVSGSELVRYLAIFIYQRKERFSFGVQDVSATMLLVLLICFFYLLRWYFGMGTRLENGVGIPAW